MLSSVADSGSAPSVGTNRAVFLGLAAGTLFGTSAVLTKAFVHYLEGGIFNWVPHWEPYALAVSSITGLVFAAYREEVIGPPLGPLVLATAEMTVALLHWVGIEAVRSATVIAHPGGFAYEVAYSCIGFLPVVFYAAAVLAYPVGWTHRLVGVVIGLPLLLALNFIRLLHLFHIGVSDRAAFAWWHEDVWPGIVRLTIIGLILFGIVALFGCAFFAMMHLY